MREMKISKKIYLIGSCFRGTKEKWTLSSTDAANHSIAQKSKAKQLWIQREKEKNQPVEEITAESCSSISQFRTIQHFQSFRCYSTITSSNNNSRGKSFGTYMTIARRRCRRRSSIQHKRSIIECIIENSICCSSLSCRRLTCRLKKFRITLISDEVDKNVVESILWNTVITDRSSLKKIFELSEELFQRNKFFGDFIMKNIDVSFFEKKSLGWETIENRRRCRCRGRFQTNLDWITITKPILQMLTRAETTKTSVDHNRHRRTQDFTFFHTEKREKREGEGLRGEGESDLWEVRMTDLPSLTSRRMTFQRNRLDDGSIPLVGSSRKAMEGSPTNDIAVDNFLRLPKDNFLTGVFRYSQRSSRVINCWTCLFSSSRRIPLNLDINKRCSTGVNSSNKASNWGQ